MKRLGLLLIVFVITSTISIAQNRGQQNYDPEEVAKKQTSELKELLDLDKAQEKKVYELNLKAANDMLAMRKEMQNGGNRDEMRAKMRKTRDKHNAEMKKVLSDSQYKKYIAQQEERRKQRQSRGGGQR